MSDLKQAGWEDTKEARPLNPVPIDTGLDVWSEGVIRVLNEGEMQFTKQCGGRTFTLAAGEEALWPGRVVAALFGHPWLRDKDRSVVAKQLYTYYGWYEDDGQNTWEGVRPRVAAFSAEGERYPLVTEDPEGLSLPEKQGPPLPPDLQRMIDERVREAVKLLVDLPVDDGTVRPGKPPAVKMTKL